MRFFINILAHNEEQSICECIASVLAQSLMADEEITVTVIANGCTDGTEEAVTALSDMDRRVRLFAIREGGKVNALRMFIDSEYYKNEQCCESIVFFMDADVTLNEQDMLQRMAGQIVADDNLYAVSACCIPESVYNSKLDFVSCLFRAQAKIHQELKPNILRGMLYCIRTTILNRITFPKNLLSDDICLEILLDGHFKTDYQSTITYTLHRGIKREIRRNFMHCLGVLQAYMYLREKKISRIDTQSSIPKYKARIPSKNEIIQTLCDEKDIKSFFFLFLHNIYYKFNGIRARRLLQKFGTDGMDYRGYWKTRK